MQLPDVPSDRPNWCVYPTNFRSLTLNMVPWNSGTARWRPFHAVDPGQMDLWKAVLPDLLWMRRSRCESETWEGCAVTNLLTLVFPLKESQKHHPSATSRQCLNLCGMTSSRSLPRCSGRANRGNVPTLSWTFNNNSWFQRMSVSNAQEYGHID